jgi:cytoskeletal protein CcmA (bactofilin family)
MDGAATQNPPGEPDNISIIGGGITVTGNIEASVDLDLQGKVHGDVKCATLILGEGAEIKGSVHAERVRASGLIEGAVETGDLAVEATARLNGDVTYSRIKIANGGIVDGKLIYRPAAAEGEGEQKLRLVETRAAARKTAAEPVHIE